MYKNCTALPAVLILILLFCFFCVPAPAESVQTPAPPESPIPAPVHLTPEPTPAPPAVMDRTKDPLAYASFRFRLDADLLEIWFPNIMNADEALLRYQGQTWLIDCGDNKMGGRGVEMMKKLGVTKIDKLFNTHPHHDHINGLAVTDKAFPVQELLICFDADSTPHMVTALAYAEESGIPVSSYQDGDVFSMGDGRVTLKFYINTDPSLDMNNASAQTLIQFGGRRIMFTADMEKLGQADLAGRVDPKDLQADILKYPHHGKSILDPTYAEAVSPLFAVVTNLDVDWEGTRYLKRMNIPYAVTNREGNYLRLITDGEFWLAEYIPVKTL